MPTARLIKILCDKLAMSPPFSHFCIEIWNERTIFFVEQRCFWMVIRAKSNQNQSYITKCNFSLHFVHHINLSLAFSRWKWPKVDAKRRWQGMNNRIQIVVSNDMTPYRLVKVSKWLQIRVMWSTMERCNDKRQSKMTDNLDISLTI